jgi:ABC-type branched-subunit amino acid transport system substrate-binding protein
VGYDVIYAVRLALQEVNAAGGVGGYSVELVAYDDRGDPTMAAEQAHKLAVDPQVMAAIGHFRGETTQEAADVYAEAGIPLVAPGVLDAGPFYRLGPEPARVAQAMVAPFAGRADARVALVTDGGALGWAVRRQAADAGVTLAAVVPVPSGEDGATQVIRAGVDGVLCDLDPVPAGEFLAALRARGWTGDFVGGPALMADDFVAVAGPAAESAWTFTPWPRPADLPEGDAFAAAYAAVSNGVAPGYLAAPAYEATRVLLAALEADIAAHGAPSRAGVDAALQRVRREGLLGPISFDATRGWPAAPVYGYRFGPAGERLPIP